MSLQSIFAISGSAMAAQTVRLNTTASNLANAESVSGDQASTYKARHPVFAAVRQDTNASFAWENDASQGVAVAGIYESDRQPQSVYRPEHPQANEQGYVFLPNISTVEEMADMIAASRSYQNNLEVLNTSKDLLLRTLRLGE